MKPLSPPENGLESTATLLARVRQGDREARERLVIRYLAVLRRWAHGRLPSGARDLLDTDDLVQTTLLRALDQVGRVEPRREGAFLAYVRRILLNQIRDEIRRTGRRPGLEDIDGKLPAPDRTPLEDAIGAETVEAYERALAALPEEQQEAVVLKIELGFTLQEVAEAMGSPSVDAARMMVTRALARLAQTMGRP